MNMQENLLAEYKLPNISAATGANTGGDPLTTAHMRNWMECVKAGNKATNGPVEAGYNHAIACSMANAAYRTGMRVTFDETTQEIMAGNKPFLY